MQDDRIATGLKDVENDASASSTSDAPKAVRAEAHAGQEAAEERSISDPARPGLDQSVPAGPLSRLLSKIPADPTEIVQALENLGEIISERVVREIRAFRREFESRPESMETRFEARLESMEKRSDARHDVQCGKIDALRSELKEMRVELKGIRTQVRLLIAMLGIEVVFLGALVTMGFIDRFSTERVAAPAQSLEVQATQAQAEMAEESASVLGSPSPASAPAREDAARTEVDPPEESEPTLPLAR